MTLEMMDFLQDRLLAGDESRYDRRSPNSVNSMMDTIVSFIRFCHARGWTNRIPDLQKIKTDEVMKGRPITEEEFQRMLEATPKVVGTNPADSWEFALKVLWESGFRVSDLLDLHWNDERHIRPVFPAQNDKHPTIVIPSTQKNGRNQEIPMLPGLQELLNEVPERSRTGWIVNPIPMEYAISGHGEWFRPSPYELKHLVTEFSNCSIAKACNVSETTVRKWLKKAEVKREFRIVTEVISLKDIKRIRNCSHRVCRRPANESKGRLSISRVGLIIAKIGKEAQIEVQQASVQKRNKHATAHDLRRRCALRLINQGVTAESVRIVMRHKSFVTTEKYYGAIRSAQSAANEIAEKFSVKSSSLVGGLMGRIKEAPQLTAEELLKLKSC